MGGAGAELGEGPSVLEVAEAVLDWCASDGEDVVAPCPTAAGGGAMRASLTGSPTAIARRRSARAGSAAG